MRAIHFLSGDSSLPFLLVLIVQSLIIDSSKYFHFTKTSITFMARLPQDIFALTPKEAVTVTGY